MGIMLLVGPLKEEGSKGHKVSCGPWPQVGRLEPSLCSVDTGANARDGRRVLAANELLSWGGVSFVLHVWQNAHSICSSIG